MMVVTLKVGDGEELDANDGGGEADGNDDGDGDGVGGQVRPSHSRGNCALSRALPLPFSSQSNCSVLQYYTAQCKTSAVQMPHSAIQRRTVVQDIAMICRSMPSCWSSQFKFIFIVLRCDNM